MRNADPQQRWADRYAVSIERWNYIRQCGALKPYHKQRDNAKARGIAWEFTPATWFDVWESSGRWVQRGHRVGQYVMARIGDVGPYAPSNVRIVPSSTNAAERSGAVSAVLITTLRLRGPMTIDAWARASQVPKPVVIERRYFLNRRGWIERCGTSGNATLWRAADHVGLAELEQKAVVRGWAIQQGVSTRKGEQP